MDDATVDEGAAPRTVAELREVIMRRGRDFDTVLTPQDRGKYNPAGSYWVTPKPDGTVEVVLEGDRADVISSEVFEDEAAAVAYLDQRIKPVRYGPPSTPEETERSRQLGEATRLRILERMEQRRRDTSG